MLISDLQKRAYGVAKEKGWHDSARPFAESISLIHSELSESLEEYRNHRGLAEIYTDEKSGKPCGIPTELADVVIRIADLCESIGINLESAIRIKMDYNKKRAYRHGGKKI